LTQTPNPQEQPILVVGGGFAGLSALQAFSRVHPRPPLVLIEPRSKFLFVPLLYELLSGELQGWEVAPDYGQLLQARGVSHVQDSVRSINLEDHVVTTNGGQRMPYSQLVLATGAVPEDFGIPGVREHALRFHSLEDIPPLQARLRELRHRPSGTSTLVIVGAGATGVELACKLVDLLDGAARVHLVEQGEQILSRSRAFNREQAERALKQRGVTVHLKTRVLNVSANAVQWSGVEGEVEQAHDGLIWTAGSRPNIPELTPSIAPHHKRLPVDETLRLIGQPDVLVLGDIASQPTIDEGQTLWPLSAQVAIQQGQAAARSLQSHRQGNRSDPFVFKDLGEMLSLGIGDATLTGMGVTLAGPLAFQMRRLAYLTRMPGLSLGLRSAGAWLFSS